MAYKQPIFDYFQNNHCSTKMASILMTILSFAYKTGPDTPALTLSPPEFFANYAVGVRVYNAIRPQESYVIQHLFFDSDEVEGPYVAAIVKSCPNGPPWLLTGTVRMIKLSSSQKQFFVPCDK
jgi:hypothetical protein